MKKAAIYCRVDNDCNPASLQTAIEIQKELLEQFATMKQYAIVGFYEDIGYSGHDIFRPGLQLLESDYQKGLFDTVLVVSFSRLYRGDLLNKPDWPFQILALNET